MNKPFISTDFCKAYHLLKYYKSLSIELSFNLRQIELHHFLKKVECVDGDVDNPDYWTVYETQFKRTYVTFDWNKESSFDKDLFIKDMLTAFENTKLTQLNRNFKIDLINNELYTYVGRLQV